MTAALSAVLPPAGAVPRRRGAKRVLPGFGLTLGYTLLYLSLIVLIPLSALVFKTFTLNWDQFWVAVTAPRVLASYRLTFGASLLAALVNLVFGLLVAWVLVRYKFPGKRIVDALVDLPFALPTAVAGISLTALLAGLEAEGPAAIVVDMQNDFVAEGAQLRSAQAAAMVPTLARTLATCRERGIRVIYTAHVHRRDGCDMGLYDDPYDRMGQLAYDMWRAVRLVVDTGMHSKGWSREQAIRFFMDNAPKTEQDIVNEIDRYIGWPGQALAYKIGQLKISELRERASRELGAKFDLREFNDEVLATGSVPLEALEKRIDAWIARKRGS